MTDIEKKMKKLKEENRQSMQGGIIDSNGNFKQPILNEPKPINPANSNTPFSPLKDNQNDLKSRIKNRLNNIGEKVHLPEINLSGSYHSSDAVKNALKRKDEASEAVKNYGDFTYGNKDLYDKALNDLLNRKEFNYDVDKDALYQQMKDRYIKEGQRAMANSMGQAAALTGGYGNSYGATVGNQAYQNSIEKINDNVPDLVRLAMERYNLEGNVLKDKFASLSTDKESERALWLDKLNKLISDRDFAANDYDATYGKEYQNFRDTQAHRMEQAKLAINSLLEAGKLGESFLNHATGHAIDAGLGVGRLGLDAGSLIETARRNRVNEALDRDRFNWDKDKFGQQLAWDKDKFGQQLAWDKDKFGQEKDYSSKNQIIEMMGKAQTPGAISSLAQRAISSGLMSKEEAADWSGFYNQANEFIQSQKPTLSSSNNTQMFDASIATPREFSRRFKNKTTKVGGKSYMFDNYDDYVKTVAEQWYKDGKLSRNDVAYIAANRGFK